MELKNIHINRIFTGFSDVLRGLNSLYLVRLFAFNEIRQRYLRSILGPFWITISMTVMIGSIGIVFGSIFKSDMSEYLPFLAAGLVVWTLISNTVAESCQALIAEARVIHQIKLPFSVFVYKVIWRNLIILGHNLIVLPPLFLVFKVSVNSHSLLFLPGLLLVVLNLLWVSILVSVICARFRDVPQIIASILQVVFYISPIIWSPTLILESDRKVILEWNPMYYLLDVIRSPLLGIRPEMNSWIFCSILCIVGLMMALFTLGKNQNKISYWL